MEGTLWKWTNYFSGWQPRWFVLSDGVLSYYTSQDEMKNGCKGSVKLSVCDVIVHNGDPTRFELTIPGEQRYHLRAPTQQDRQRWVIALGTAKAGGQEGTNYTTFAVSTSVEEVSALELHTKRSELRLYRDLLAQQVSSIQGCLQENQVPNMEHVNELSGMLHAACSTFLTTLDECMTLIQAQQHPHTPPTSPQPHVAHSTDRKTALSAVTNCVGTPTVARHMGEASLQHPTVTELCGDGEGVRPPLRPRTPRDRRIQHTFFSRMAVSFEDICLTEGDEIPTIQFLEAWRSLVDIFDHLNKTGFAPVKIEAQNNIKKLEHKSSAHPSSCSFLQGIVRSEVMASQSEDANSASSALLWLARTLEFLECLLTEVCNHPECEDVTNIAQTVYSRTLKQHHGWVVRGVLAMAVGSLPSRTNLLLGLAGGASMEQVSLDLKRYSAATRTISGLLKTFLAANLAG